MSAPLLQTVKLIKLAQKCRFAGRVTSANQLRHFSDEKPNNGESIDDENISNNSLKLKLAETDDIPDQLKPVKVAENESDEIKPPKAITSSYAKTFERLESLRTGIDSKPMPTESFATMLRHSKFIQLGDISGKVVVGKIAEIHGDDLYIDFGGKFYCVCQKPQSQEWLVLHKSVVFGPSKGFRVF